MTDERPSLGEVLHRARQASTDGRDRPWPVEDWADRDPRLQAIDEAMAAAVAKRAVHDAGFDQAQLVADIIRLRVRLDHAVQNERDTIARAILDRADRATPGVERDALLTAAAIAKGTEP